MAGFLDWSTTAASNASVGSINWTEGQLPSTVNNSARQVMADLRYELAAVSSTTSAGATVDLGAFLEGSVVLSGNATITSFGSTGTQGLRRLVRATGTPTIAHSVGGITCVGSADMVLAAGDVIEVECQGSGTWRVIDYQPLAGYALDSGLAKLSTVNTFTATQTWSKGADVSAGAALALGSDGNYFDITGTTTITSIATKGVGTVVKLHFDDALTLTHHSTDLVLPGAANITTAAGDEFEFTEYASGDWRCTGYVLASGKSISSVSSTIMVFSDTVGTVAGGETKYYGVSGVSVTEATVSVRVPFACTARNMYTDVSTAPGGAQTITYTLRKNETADTALTCQVSASDRSSVDSTHTVTFAAGDYLAVKTVASASAVNALHKISIELVKI